MDSLDAEQRDIASLLLSDCGVLPSDNNKLQEVLDRSPDAASLLEKFVNLPIDPAVAPTSVAAIEGNDLRRAMLELTNDYVPRQSPSREVIRAAEEFRNLYGELWPGYEPSDYSELVSTFRSQWTAKNQADRKQFSVWLEKLLKSQIRPARLADAALPYSPLMKVGTRLGTVELPIETVFEMVSSRGAVRFAPRSLLDYLAIWLVKFRKQGKLAICELTTCPHPYYVKMHPRYRYCSQDCSDQARSTRKSLWWRENHSPAAQRTPSRKRRSKSPRR